MKESAPVLNLQDAIKLRETAKKAGKVVVFTNGCFDILHLGHVALIREASCLGDYLIVGLNSDRSVTRLKGTGRPFVPEGDRANILASLKWVDGVVIFEEDTPFELVDSLRPDILVKGGDYAVDEVVGRDIVEGDGGKVAIIPLLPGYSTSDLVASIIRNTDLSRNDRD
jgi:D-beta-D-heptose 7-phosphate kinase/D-beta-D-heptose 1-phosphate adenosyltransferase